MHVDLQNVFTPAAAIDDIARFAGRQEQLDAVGTALQSRGTQIVVYGNRGVGKSSLARQLSSLARGEQTIERLSMPPHEKPDYLVISFECDDSIGDTEQLVLRLLTDDNCLAPWIPFRVESRGVTNEISGGINVKIFNVSAKKGGNELEKRDAIDLDIYSAFSNAVTHIIDSGVAKSGVLFIIDEVDRIKNRDNLASFVRSRAADHRIKFALVGVSTTPQELILNHESIARQISDGCIEMPPMSQIELREIFDHAHKQLFLDAFTFTKGAQDWIIDIARGHPYYVHLLGKHSLLRAAGQGLKDITETMARDALADIAVKGTARIQETTYQKAIGHSYTREFIVKRFARVAEDEMSTTAVYADIASTRNMDTGSISVYVGQLTSENYGSVLEKVRERHYRFKDSLFKAYAAARPFKFKEAQVEKDD